MTTRYTWRMAALAGALGAVLGLGARTSARAEPSAPGDPTPEQVVTRYLTAMKASDFAAAYDQLTKAMVQNKNRDEWAKEQQWMTQMSDAKVFEFKVYPGKIEGEKAFVPNVLSSQDKFFNQLGVEEHELYTLVRENGRWKINQQELLEKEQQGAWFTQAAPK
jgi:hypothetical protein